MKRQKNTASLGLGLVALGIIAGGNANAATIGNGDQFNLLYTVQINGACLFGAGSQCPLPTGEFAGAADGSSDVLFAPTAIGDEDVDVLNRVIDSAPGVDMMPGDLGVVRTAGGNTGVFSNFGSNVPGEIRAYDGSVGTDLDEVNDTGFGADRYFQRLTEPGTGNVFVFSLVEAEPFEFNIDGSFTNPPAPNEPLLGDYAYSAVGELAIYTPGGVLLDSADVDYRTTGQFLFDCNADQGGLAGCGTADPLGGDLVTNLTSSSFSEITVVDQRTRTPEPSSILGLGFLSSLCLLSVKKKFKK